MRKQYNAWTTLCGQTGVGYNEATQTITMELERWDEYLKGHPDAKIFRTKSLSVPNEMTTLFGGTQARGADAWTPSSGSFPEDLSMQMASLLPDIGNTQNDVQQETYEDVEMEELMSNVRRKRPSTSRSRKNVKISKFDESLERIVIILEGEKNEEEMEEKERKDEETKEAERREKEKDKERKVEETKQGPTMHECTATLKLIPNIKETSELYFFGTRAFKDKDNRNIFMSFESDDARIYWLNMILKHLDKFYLNIVGFLEEYGITFGCKNL